MSFMDLFRPKWQHSDWHVRLAAMEQLTDQTLLARIARTDGDSDVRKAAVAKLTDQALLAEIARTDWAWEVKDAAMGTMTDQVLLAQIARADKSERVRKAAVAKLTDEALLADLAWHEVQNLIERVKTEKGDTRVSAIRELGKRRDTRAIDTLLQVRMKASSREETAAVAALAEIGDPRVLDPLVAWASSDPVHVKRAVIAAIGELHDPRGFPHLIQFLTDDNPFDRMAAARALGVMGMKEALPHLIGVLTKGDDPMVMRESADAIAKCGGTLLDDQTRAIIAVAGGDFHAASSLGAMSAPALLKRLTTLDPDDVAPANDMPNHGAECVNRGVLGALNALLSVLKEHGAQVDDSVLERILKLNVVSYEKRWERGDSDLDLGSREIVVDIGPLKDLAREEMGRRGRSR